MGGFRRAATRQRGEITIVVTRNVKEWSLPSSEHVVLYGAGEARGAHLTVASFGGKAIAKRLGIDIKT